jgi:hypothetical protein
LKTQSFSMAEGNHRAYVLLEYAEAGILPWDQPIYVRGLEAWRARRAG